MDHGFLITLLIIALAGLSNWLQRRAQAPPLPPPERPQGTGVPPAIPRRRPTTPPSTPPTLESMLERQLRELLGGEPMSSPQPPPVVLRPAPVAPALPPAEAAGVPVPSLPVPQEVVAHALPPAVAAQALAESNAAYHRAERLHELVADRLRHVDERMKGVRALTPAGAGVASVSPLSGGVRALRGNAPLAREAFIASLVFGPPKGLEDSLI